MELIEKLRDIFNKIDKQKLVLLASIIGVMLLIIITISFVVKIIGVRISYESLEEKLEIAAEKYMTDYPNNLPTKENSPVVISATTLVENKYIKELKKYVKDSSCTANINVYYNDGNYDYQAFLTCNNFKTKTLLEKLKSDNTISSFGEGLYELNNELVYRGQNPNNYLKFSGDIWRIIKVNNDGKIILIKQKLESSEYGNWDNRYNSEADSVKGINNFSLSRALSTIKEIYEEKYSKNSEYLSTFDICTGKRNEFDASKNGIAECSTLLKEQYIGLLPVYDFMNASLDNSCTTVYSKECQNYNYLTDCDDKWWTVTGDSKSTYNVYYIDYSGSVESEEAVMNANYRYTLALKNNILYKSGSGTLSDPYIVR